MKTTERREAGNDPDEAKRGCSRVAEGGGWRPRWFAKWPVEFWAGLGVACLAWTWFLTRLSPSVALGPWQGPLLSEHPVPDLPILSRGVARLVLAACGGEASRAAVALNGVSAAFGALCCAVLAVAAVSLCKRIAGPVESLICGVGAGVLLALTPTMTYGATGAGPTTLSSFLALGALALLSCGMGAARRPYSLFVSGLCAGLAAANHPAFALLLPILLIGGQSPSLKGTAHALLGSILPGFLLGASVPYVTSVVTKETTRDFLAHALQTPYPSIGESGPQFDFGRELVEELPLVVLVAALVFFVLSLREKTRSRALLWGAAFLVLGPFLPALTNQYGREAGLRDPVAPFCVVLAAVCLLPAVGGALFAALVVRKARGGEVRRAVAAAAVLATIFVLTLGRLPGTESARRLPNRNHELAMELGKLVLADCPENGLLISGDDALTSLVGATQMVAGYRRDVVVVATEWLVAPRLRERMVSRLPEGVRLPATFPPEYAWRQWQREQPLLLSRAAADPLGEESASYLDLAIWDAVRDNHRRRAVCFIGLSSPWLTARATRRGSMLVYPDFEERSSTTGQGLEHLAVQASGGPDSGLAEAIVALLLPQSGNALLQDGAPEALRLAKLAAELRPEDPLPWLAMARAAARSGLKDSALDSATKSIRLFGDQHRSDGDSVTTLLTAEFERRDAIARFRSSFVELGGAEPLDEGQRDLAAQLWEVDELVVLEKGYAQRVESRPGDVEAIYERAAALAQLGRLALAQDLLTRALELEPNVVSSRLMNDGRFALLIRDRIVDGRYAKREATSTSRSR